jgi:ABC-type branched-subunit amino acid transport system permease subunit
VGAAIYVFAEYFIRLAAPERWPLFVGILFVFSIMFLRKGVCLSIYEKLKATRNKRQES